MDPKRFVSVFLTVFAAEMGDKTQVATLLYSSQEKGRAGTVFLAASLALVLASGLGVLAGAQLGRWMNPAILRWIAGFGFIAIGLWTLLRRP